MSGDKRSNDRDPFLLRLANGVEAAVGLLNAELGMVVFACLLALFLGASLVGVLLELLIGVAVLTVVALVGTVVMFFFSD
ncbi:hypothetical protein [Labrenzia sp. VG12]|uniref:hypothetical protein n=1 Tax=Labrenzia sp. VG12 TaxID=2021862 RepID=UPI0012FD9D92|nr:hypothetical protein [Labrenzia sp. VG12]